MIRTGMLGVPFRTGFGPFGQFMTANEIMERIHKARAPEPHWYLMVVGVDPELQRQGAGSRNLPFYERLGFIVLEEATLGKGGPKAWAMRREPQSTTP